MASNAVEILAREMCPVGTSPDDEVWVREDVFTRWHLYVPRARRALVNMRDSPSKAMILSGAKALSDNGVDNVQDDDVEVCWKHMCIGALLEVGDGE